VSVGNLTNGTFTSSQDISTTPLYGAEGSNYYVIRQANFSTLDTTTYTLTDISTSKGSLNIPQLGSGTLSLHGRDSKWHVTDYDLGGTKLLYSTAEIFTWKKFEDKTVLVVYGGSDELHELAIVSSHSAHTIEGSGITTKSSNGTSIINFTTSPTRRVVQVGSLFVYILDRNTAYNYWVPDFERTDAWAN
jgi:hypothetical protein